MANERRAIDVIKEKIRSLREEADHPTTRRLGLSTSCRVTANDLQWAVDLLEAEEMPRKAAAFDKLNTLREVEIWVDRDGLLSAPGYGPSGQTWMELAERLTPEGGAKPPPPTDTERATLKDAAEEMLRPPE